MHPEARQTELSLTNPVKDLGHHLGALDCQALIAFLSEGVLLRVPGADPETDDLDVLEDEETGGMETGFFDMAP